MNLISGIGMLIGAEGSTHTFIYLGQKDKSSATNLELYLPIIKSFK